MANKQPVPKSVVKPITATLPKNAPHKKGDLKLPVTEAPLKPSNKPIRGSLTDRGNAVSKAEAVRAVEFPGRNSLETKKYHLIRAYEQEMLNSVKNVNGDIKFLVPDFRVDSKYEDESGGGFAQDWHNQATIANLEDDVSLSPYNATQLRQILQLVPLEYRDIAIRYWAEYGVPGNIISDELFLQGIVRAHNTYLTDLFVNTARSINLQQLTNMSDHAMAVFLLSQTSQEVWDRDLNVVPYVEQREYIAANPIWQFLQGSIEQGRGIPWRIAGTSFGASNVYVRQLIEALDFMTNVQSSPNAYSIDPAQINTDLVQIYPLNYTSLVGNEFQSVAALAYIMNWAGARGMIGEGSGDTDIPAINPDNFGRQTTSVQEISAFSLGIVRYQDAVLTGFEAHRAVSQTGDFWKLISVIEDMPNQSSVLGYSMGYDSNNDIVIGTDFIPYNSTEARAIVEAIRSVESVNAFARQTLCRSELLQQSYREYTGEDPLAEIDCP